MQTQVLTKYPADGVDGRCQTLRCTGNHCVGGHNSVNHSVVIHSFVTHSSVFHSNGGSHYDLRKGKAANGDVGDSGGRGHQVDKMVWEEE